MNKFKKFMALGLAAMMVTSLVACGGSTGNAKNKKSDSSKGTTVTFWNSFTGADGDMLVKMVDKFNKENTDGIKVKMDISSDFDSQLSTAFAAGEGPTMILSSSAYRFTYGDYLQDVSDVFDKTDLNKDDFIQSYLDSGIYEPDNKNADEDGFRQDVIDRVKEMNVTTVRYPGGNFVSAYHWEDGVGAKEKRPHKLDLAWRSIETNEFGTNEFMKWAKKTNVNPIFTVNLGTRGVEDAAHYLEYCNFSSGTQYSDMRKSHGVDEPYGIKMWCLGNEMDGSWQIGHKSAEEYGKIAAETGKVMKLIDPDIELIVCGSSLSSMDTYPEWDMEVLDKTYDVADYLALHQYYAGQEKGTKTFLAQSVDMEEYIHTIRSVAQVIKQKKRSKKDMKFSVDEWGVWAVPSNTVNNEIDEKPWQIAPAISEQIYTLEDALLFAEMQMVIIRNADAIKIACQSLLTNISACIMTEKGGGHWLQTIYYPFYYFANYAKGIVLNVSSTGPVYDCKEFNNVPYVDSIVVWNDEDGELVFFAVNRDEDNKQKVSLQLSDFEVDSVIESIGMTAADKKMTNQFQHDAVKPETVDNVKLGNGEAKVVLKPLSFNVVRLRINQ